MNKTPLFTPSPDPKELTPVQLRALILNAEKRNRHFDQVRSELPEGSPEWQRLWRLSVAGAERLSLLRSLLALETRVAEQAAATPVHAS